ncbi:hypothetical protein PGT21_014031 [Puccinia graminis f. sp. tritici]|uniref:Peptidase A1 domain-containing protein n=2 Tax=Puccinia graminis f. sp. tritici TaxID=56615 RepID=E3KBY4_PUCGT|nr:uncharacterized protein PGTG_08035 [Puccinia graminis f. sp. tritici CRL 75-36-700-3]EFP81786.2 hypothetical protein PGTG_08035 [Puccinia graminis f. sp. tritici CRL 75-36-700-3]KAA1117544.1 hypothetical protein PGT21_014031 [Puccinia graminis f. sp. tritici]
MRSLSFCLQLVSISLILLTCHRTKSTPNAKPLHIPLRIAAPHLTRRENTNDFLDFETWATQAGSKLNSRYGGQTDTDTNPSEIKHSLHPRQVANVRLTNAFSDAIYTAPITIGTPPQSFNMIMDTGSGDLWIADSSCNIDQGCPASARKFDPLKSTTYVNQSKAFNVQYGSGKAQGILAKESVSVGGLTVLSQLLGICDSVENILRPGLDISGIMGLAWSGIASSPSTPAWESLFLQDALSEPVISFALSRLNRSHTQTTAPGGTMTIGGTNKRHYEGGIDYVPLAKNQSYWLIPLESITVGGKAVEIGTPNIAIDTGTSLIGGPDEDLRTIFSVVPGAALMQDGSFKGYWTIPCNNPLTISVQFGSISYPINPLDTNLGKINQKNRCLTSFFTISKSKSGGSIPGWIFGAAFLKNVYSVFRASPPSIGFAQLSSTFVGEKTLSPRLISQHPLEKHPLKQASKEAHRPQNGGSNLSSKIPPIGLLVISTVNLLLFNLQISVGLRWFI